MLLVPPAKTGVPLKSVVPAGAIARIHELTIGMHVHRAGGLRRRHVTATCQRALAEHWLLAQRVIGHSGEDIQLVLRLERQEDPRSRRMKIQMPRSKADALSRRNRRAIREACRRHSETL